MGWDNRGQCRACDGAQVSVSPQGFPNEKIVGEGVDFSFAPLFTGEVFFWPQGVARGCHNDSAVRLRESCSRHVGAAVAVRPDQGQKGQPFPAGTSSAMTDSKPAPASTRARITPAGLMFLAITSIGWGFNWPATKYLIGELPPLTLRGASGVLGALLLASMALIRGQSLAVPREIWP